MKLSRIFFLIAVSFTIFFIAGDTKAQADRPIKNNGDVQKWEYCVIYGESNSSTKDKKTTGLVMVAYLEENGEREERIEFALPDDSKSYSLAIRKAINKAFGKLGNEGWEFVGNFHYAPGASNDTAPGFFFKRPKK